jgi:hypothetical protein
MYLFEAAALRLPVIRGMWGCALILVPSSHTHITVSTNQLPYPKVNFFVVRDMGDQLASSRFEALFEEALREYEKQTGTPLAKHPLAEQFQSCQSVESVTSLLQEQTQALSDFRGTDKIMKSLKSLVSALSRVSAVAALGHNIGLVCPGY